MPVEAIAYGLTGGESLGRFVPPELSDNEYIVQASQNARREAEFLLRAEGQVRRWNPVVQAGILLVDAVVFMGAPPIITPFNSTRLHTTVARGEHQATIAINAHTIKDPKEAEEIEVKIKTAEMDQSVRFPKSGSGLYRGHAGMLSDRSLTRSEAEAYSNLLGVIRACYYPTPRTEELVCVDKTKRGSMFPIYLSRHSKGEFPISIG